MIPPRTCLSRAAQRFAPLFTLLSTMVLARPAAAQDPFANEEEKPTEGAKGETHQSLARPKVAEPEARPRFAFAVEHPTVTARPDPCASRSRPRGREPNAQRPKRPAWASCVAQVGAGRALSERASRVAALHRGRP